LEPVEAFVQIDFTTLIHKPSIAKVLFLVLLLLFVFQLFFNIKSLYYLDDVFVQKPSPIAQNKPPANITAIQNLSIFGDYISDDMSGDDIKKTVANLKLVGIMYSAQEENSMAMIQTESGQEKMFHVGDQISDGIYIRRITPGGIVLSRDGRLEKLNLPKDEINFETPPKPLFEE
tara:strand:- start:1458 stop:1982 length:525 start_codon:yes stop_codon:yes gene_type:complete